MKTITHEEQKKIWNEEHKNPLLLKQMDSKDMSTGVVKFYDFLITHSIEKGRGREMGCGKGRNVIGLAEKGFEMYGFDFSDVAIEEAKRRAKEINSSANFLVQDATLAWDFDSDYFDFVIDCYASTDIESEVGRSFARNEIYRVLKSGGYFLAVLLSSDSDYHNEIALSSAGPEKNTFLHPLTGKFEKTFDEVEIESFYGDFNLVAKEKISKISEFLGKKYNVKTLWYVFQKR